MTTGAGDEVSDMACLENSPQRNASLHRRGLLTVGGAALLAACSRKSHMTASDTPPLDAELLKTEIDAIARRAPPAGLGVGLINLDSGETWQLNGERRFPMQSVFKLPLAAAVLSEVDLGRLLMSERIYLLDEHLSPQFSPIASAWPARRDYSYDELFTAMVIDSDNTAADVLMRRIGGPGAVTAWLTGKLVPDLRIDRYERELQPSVYGMASFRPDWRDDAAYGAAKQAVPPATRMTAMRAFMADPRDTATPRGMLEFLQQLDRESLISPASTKRLLELMGKTVRGAGRIRAGLPKDAFLAHRPGTSGVDQGLNTAHNDVGIFVLPDKRAYGLAVFLSGSTLDDAGRDAIIADVTRAAVKGAR
jgi:beta-lactamase class A